MNSEKPLIQQYLKKEFTITDSTNSNISKEIGLPIFGECCPFLCRGDLDDYLIGKEIGNGAYAAVRMGIHKNSDTKTALKFYDMDSMASQ